jgi:SOS-response transcriptional repressor LexA
VQNIVTRKQDAISQEKYGISSFPVSDDALCFKIVDHSMEPEYRIGEIVFIDKLQLEPGDHVVAHVKSQNATIFRVFEYDGADHCKLSPLNTQYRVLRFANEDWSQDVEIIGVMVYHGRVRRIRHSS